MTARKAARRCCTTVLASVGLALTTPIAVLGQQWRLVRTADPFDGRVELIGLFEGPDELSVALRCNEKLVDMDLMLMLHTRLTPEDVRVALRVDDLPIDEGDGTPTGSPPLHMVALDVDLAWRTVAKMVSGDTLHVRVFLPTESVTLAHPLAGFRAALQESTICSDRLQRRRGPGD